MACHPSLELSEPAASSRSNCEPVHRPVIASAPEPRAVPKAQIAARLQKLENLAETIRAENAMFEQLIEKIIRLDGKGKTNENVVAMREALQPQRDQLKKIEKAITEFRVAHSLAP